MAAAWGILEEEEEVVVVEEAAEAEEIETVLAHQEAKCIQRAVRTIDCTARHLGCVGHNRWGQAVRQRRQRRQK
jgi:hypothetical protein